MTRRLLAAPLAAVLLTIVALSSPAQAVRADEPPVPVTAQTFTVTGNGFGHGHGMSQYGADGAAKQGLSAAQILAFYYPGTVAAGAGATLRVLVTAATNPATVVRATRGLKVKDLGRAAKATRLPHRGTAWRLRPVGGRTLLQYKTKKWHTFKLHRKKYLVGDGEFRSPSGVTLRLPDGSTRLYRGAIRSASPTPGAGTRGTVNVVALDDYLRGVVPAEMPSTWSPAALQAQAVAARTYAMWSVSFAPNRWYQICDTTACQVYRGAGAEAASTDAAVAATAGRILTYGGAPAFTQFSASNGGYESAGGTGSPYLVAQNDPYDAAYRHWQVAADRAVAERAYPQLGALQSITVVGREAAAAGGPEWGGRVTSLTLTGSTGAVTISGDTFRSLYGLRSSWFQVS